ncbi:MAG: hypothetical protein QM765_03570 [Myxococcales bacterium]
MAKDAADKTKADPKKQEPTGKKVFCVRNQVDKTAPEHLTCPYCFGKKSEQVENGERKEFCDFDPEKDPTSFGFPENSSRNLKG